MLRGWFSRSAFSLICFMDWWSVKAVPITVEGMGFTWIYPLRHNSFFVMAKRQSCYSSEFHRRAFGGFRMRLFWCRVLTLFHPYLEIKDQHVVHLKSLNIKRWIPGIPLYFDLPATIGTNLEHPQVRTASDGQKLSGMASGPQGVHSECNIIFHHLPAMWCNLTSNEIDQYNILIKILRAHVLTRRWE